MDKRIIDLALEALEIQKAALEAEIEQIRAVARSGIRKQSAKAVTAAVGRRRPRTAAQRKAQSARMRAYWRKRKAQTAEAKPARKAISAEPRAATKTKSAAARKASERMKAFWAKKRAEAAKAASKKAPKQAKAKPEQ